MTPEIYQIFTSQLHVKRRKKFEGRTSSNMHCSLWETRTFQRVTPVCEGCVSKHSSNMPISLPHHLVGMTLHQPRFHVFLIFLELKCHVTPCIRMHACVHVMRQICLKIPYNSLHMELTRIRVHKYDFSNHFCKALLVDVVQI